MPETATNTEALVKRISALTAQLIERNRALEAEVDDLRDHIEGLTTKLTAAKAATHTQTQDADAALNLQLQAEAERDTQRLERLRAELDDYLRDIDRRLANPPTHGDQTQ